MNRGDTLAREALRAALSLRLKRNKSLSEPICIYDFVEELGIPVRFMGGSSFEGMYSKHNNMILVPSQRPPGRQAFACAHELGHWFFKHGTRVDALDEGAGCRYKSPEEQLADFFASFLLMPSKAVKMAFTSRDWTPSSCSPLQVYTVACQLGVGYETILNHMRYSLKSISQRHFDQLKKVTPKDIRNVLLTSTEDPGHLVIADQAWRANVPIDLQVGHMAIVPVGVTAKGEFVEPVKMVSNGMLVVARKPGISEVASPDKTWAAFLRISRKEFVGRSVFRHLEEAEDDE